MCGIAGIVGKAVAALQDPKAVVEAMASRLAHRGPDATGALVDDEMAFGHRRLKVIDLVGGAQPMTTADGRFVLAYNGEVYNYRSLRSDLEGRGCRFGSTSDTEVLLELLAQGGSRAIEKVIGMFAVALWDRRDRRLVLIRDRLGVKPLWYATLPDGSLVFGSEIKALLAVPGVERRLDRQALADYLLFRQPGRTKSLFEGIRQVPPGSMLVWEDHRTRLERYWRLSPGRGDRALTDKEAVATVRREVTAAVQRRLVSDVPLGAYLSGGLDSSIVVAAMAESSSIPVKTFSIGFPDAGFNEFEYARLVAERYATDHHEIEIDLDDYTDLWHAMVRFRDAPLSVPNEVALYRMSLELKKHITVVLSGEGADELFAGYGRIFRSADDFTRLNALATHPDLVDESLRALVAGSLVSRYGKDVASDAFEFFLRRYRWFAEADAVALLDRQTVQRSAMTEEMSDAFGEASELDLPSRYLYLFQLWHLHGLLMRLDATTMASAVEARVPFVDHTLIEAIFPMAFEQKIRFLSPAHQLAAVALDADRVSERYDVTKWALREAFAASLPERVVSRRKVGFPVPLGPWLRRGLVSFAREVLNQRAVREAAVFSPDAVERLLEGADAEGGALRVWMLANVGLFLTEYFG